MTVETKHIILLWLSVLLLISKWTESAIGPLTLSPMNVAPVCRVGDPLQITCIASIEFTSWSIFRVNEQGMLERAIHDEPINSEDLVQMPEPTMTELATFTIMRTSARNVLPLISTLSIDMVSIGLNGTVVNCMDGRRSEERNASISASTTIKIIDTNQSIQLIPELNISEPHYDTDNVTVTVEWAQLEPGIVYSVEVMPNMPIGNFTENTRYQLTIPYNKIYNFSVMATTPCRLNTTAFISIILHYAKCEHPQDLLSTGSNVSVSRIVGPNGIPVEGSTTSFSCPQGSELNGSISAICSQNGEWEPNLKGFTCTQFPFHETVPQSCPTSCTQTTDNSLAAAVSSTVIIFLVISILTFIGGFISGLFVDRKFSSKRASHVTAERPRQVPLYDDVLFDAGANRQEQKVELKPNVAYRSPKPTVVEVN